MPAAKPGPKVESLLKGGFAIKTPLPKAYADVIEKLSPAEVKMLVDLKKALDAAQSKTPANVGSYTEYFYPF